MINLHSFHTYKLVTNKAIECVQAIRLLSELISENQENADIKGDLESITKSCDLLASCIDSMKLIFSSVFSTDAKRLKFIATVIEERWSDLFKSKNIEFRVVFKDTSVKVCYGLLLMVVDAVLKERIEILEEKDIVFVTLETGDGMKVSIVDTGKEDIDSGTFENLRLVIEYFGGEVYKKQSDEGFEIIFSFSCK